MCLLKLKKVDGHSLQSMTDNIGAFHAVLPQHILIRHQFHLRSRMSIYVCELAVNLSIMWTCLCIH